MKTNNFFIKTTSATLLVLLLGVAHSPAVWAKGESADSFIREVGQEAIQSLTNKRLNDQERQDLFREILNRTFKIQLIAKFTLGRYWRRATKAQQQEYVGLFEDFIVLAYAARFRDYTGENFSVGQVRQINDRDKLVHSKLVLKNGRNIPVLWRVRGNDGFKIIDVLVEGVSMAITQRDEFSAIINQRGGKIEGLLAALRKKTGRR